MKLTKTTTAKSFLLLFLLISSFLISIQTKTSKAIRTYKSLSQRLSKTSYTNTNNNNSKRSPKKEDNIEKAINMFDFTLGILTCLPIIDDYAQMLEDFIENSDKCDKAEIIGAYRAGVEKRKDARFLAAITTLDNTDSLKSKLPWRPSEEMEETIHLLEATNPKKACEAILAEQARQRNENKKYLKIYEGALVAAKDIKSKNMSFDEFVKKLPFAYFSIFNSENKNNYLNLKHYFKRTIFAHLKLKSIEELKVLVANGEVNWPQAIDDAIEFLSDNNKMAKLNLQEMGFGEDEKKPNCSKLPSDTNYQENKTTILDRFAGGWGALKYVGKCVIESLPNHGYEFLKDKLMDILKDLGIQFLEKLVMIFGSVLTNMLTFFALKAVKILWWVIKAVYYVYKAIDKEEGKYKYWGKAVGAGIRVIYIAFMPTERRRLKLRK